ncbi:MAG: response regulator, partial [Chloroflexi bacterium]|nr:response regulator [Chloroflexota bacterium]
MNEKVLVVDDDPSMARLIEHILQGKGYQVITTNNGLKALKIARSEELDMIILDLMLPGVDGFEVCHQLREEPNTADVPILVLS